jgi:hypothetical protein
MLTRAATAFGTLALYGIEPQAHAPRQRETLKSASSSPFDLLAPAGNAVRTQGLQPRTPGFPAAARSFARRRNSGRENGLAVAQRPVALLVRCLSFSDETGLRMAQTRDRNGASLNSMDGCIDRPGGTAGEGETLGSSVPALPAKLRGDDLRNVHVDQLQPNTAL